MAFRKLTPQELSISAPPQQQSQQSAGPSGLTGFLRTLASPFRKTLGSGFELSKGIADRTGMNVSEEQRAFNPFLGQQELQNIRQKPGQQSLKNLLGIGSFFVPGGKGTNIATKAILPGAASAGMFEAGQDDATVGSVAQSAGVGGATGGALNLLGKGFGKVKSLFGKGKGAIQDKSLNAVLNTSTSKTDDFISRRGVTPADALRNLVQRSGRGARNLDDLVGPVSAKNRGGIVNDVLGAAETQIDDAIIKRGEGVILSGDDIINRLTQRRQELSTTLGNESKLAQLDELIEKARVKYASGVTPRQALATVRQANSAWGKAQTLTGKEAVLKQVGIEEADVLRDTLKGMFPDISDALDTQADGLALQGILSNSRASGVKGKFNLGALDFTRPGSAVDKVVNRPEVATRVGGIAGAPTPTQAGVPLPQPQGRLGDLLGDAGQQAKGALPTIGAGQFFGGQGEADTIPEAPVTSQLLQTGVDSKSPKGLARIFTPEMLTMALVSGELTSSDIGALQKLGIVQPQPSIAERKVQVDFNVSVHGLKTLRVQIGKIRNAGDIATYNTQKALVGQQVARLFETGRLSDEDRNFYQKQIPGVAFIMLAPELAQKRIDAITSLLEQRANTVSIPGQEQEGLLQ